jgi:hypothetical protein
MGTIAAGFQRNALVARYAHTTQRSKGGRHYQIGDLQGNQKWPASGL